MAKARTSTAPRGSVGLDLDGDFLAAVSVAEGRIQAAVSAELPEGVMHDGLSTPLVYLDDVHVPPLLRRLDAETRVTDVLDRWSAAIGTRKAAQVLAWLLRHDVVRTVSVSCGSSSINPRA